MQLNLLEIDKNCKLKSKLKRKIKENKNQGFAVQNRNLSDFHTKTLNCGTKKRKLKCQILVAIHVLQSTLQKLLSSN